VFVAGGAGAAPRQLSGRIVESSFASTAGELAYDVYLPPGYDGSSLRYPVIYYLHGLPAGPESFRTFGYVPAALEAAGFSAIVVAPQGATVADTDPEYLDLGAGQNWDTAIGVQLPQVIDATYRTIPARGARAIIGVSAGGYGAMLLGLHHLGLFSAIESWSGYFHPTDASGTRSISSRTWLSAHAFVRSLNRAFQVNPTFLGFYVGEHDARFRQENVELARQLSRAKVPFAFRIYPGGHNQQLWSSEASTWLTQLMSHLEAPTNPSG
jgi:enterochelin esterase-like enzyme